MPFRFRLLFLLFLLATGHRVLAIDYEISLKDLVVTSSMRGYYVEKVINVSSEESCIGFVQTGMFNKQVPAVMNPTISGEVEECLKRSIPENKSLKPLIIRINRLYIYELTWSSKEIACIELSVSFITRDSTGYTDRFLAGVSFSRNGLDVTGFHSDNIIQALGECFDHFQKASELGKWQHRPISENELMQNPLNSPRKFAVFKNKPTRGLFKTFYSFRDGHPDSATKFIVNYKIPKKDTLRVRASLELPDHLSQKEYYAFCDGKDLFVWAGSGFAKVIRRDSAFYVKVDAHDANEGASSGVYMAGLLGGALGGLLAALATEATMAAATGPGSCYVDFVSGRLIPVNIPDYLKVESNTIFFLSHASPEDTKLLVINQQDTLCSLVPGNYLKLSLPSKFRELTLIFTGQDIQKREETIQPRLFNTDLFLVRVKRNREITIGNTFDQVRKTVLDGMTDENTFIVRKLSSQPVIK